ncbi:MAG: Ig-like domain-containing protein [Prevotella sp.]|nr:Ig-like domain-containing protein [Prevotella sp.]
MKTKNLLRKAFLLLALMGGVNSAWGADEVVFLWQYDGSSTYGDGSNNGEFPISNSSGIGTVKFVTYDKKKTSADGISSYNSSVTDNDLKPSIANACKLGNNGAHIKISPASGNFKAGDIIYICGYNPVLVTTSTDPTSTGKITTDTGTGGVTTVIAPSLATGTSKSSCAVGSVTLPDDFTETDAIYISRVPSTSVFIAAIKVVRPDPSKSSSDLTLTSSTTVTLDPEETSQITYTTSSTGAFTYTSSATGIATVSSTGLITAVAYGTATITIAQAADNTYNAGSKTVTVNVNRKATEVTGEFILDTTNGSLDGKVYTSNDGSVIIECGSTGSGSNTYYDNKNSHYKSSGDCLITLPTNYAVSTIQYIGYSNSTSDRTITLKEVDGVAVSPQPSGTILKKDQIPATDCVGFELETPATESIKINIASECRGYFILNPGTKNITMTQVGTKYYATFYSAGEMTITGAKAYTAEFNEGNSELILTECAGGVVGGRTGVILIGNSSSATATPSFTGATKSVGDLIGVAEKAVSMSSYYAASTSETTANKVFVLGNNEGVGFYKYTGSSLGVNKAYLYTDAFASGSARAITFKFGDDATSIDGVNTETIKNELKKFFDNGQLVIEKNGQKFNANGQQIK